MEIKELDEFIAQIKEHDFFKEGRDDFFDGRVVQSDIVYGKHWNKAPLVTIIITTYKRPKLLRQALESALNQEKFSDYQVLVVDNEAAPLEQETETSVLMQLYQNNEKVIYYRNKVASCYTTDTAIYYAKSKWICILHDDDFLVRNHLKIMTGIVVEHPEISYLGCPLKVFYDDISDSEYNELVQPVAGSFLVVHYTIQYACTGYVPGWLGALIDRERYISIGGMPKLNTGIGDCMMQGKFMKKWSIHRYEASHGLYCYRKWRGQISAKGEVVWMKGYIAEYYWNLYLNKNLHFYTRKFWNRISAYRIIDKLMCMSESYWGTKIDLSQMNEYCEWDEDMLENGLKKSCYLKIEKLYKKFYCHIIRCSGIKGRVGEYGI